LIAKAENLLSKNFFNLFKRIYCYKLCIALYLYAYS